LALLAAGAARADSDEPSLAESVRARLVRFRVAPHAGAARDACVGLQPTDLAIRLRGRALDPSLVVSLERDVRPMLHALVIDRSGSMDDKLEAARAAARGYVDRMRPGLDRGLVVAFDEDVVLVAKATADPTALARAIDGVALGGRTALRDALHAVIGELSIHLERPVVLLLSDGADTASVTSQDEVLALAATRRDLAVFPIGVGLPEIGAAGPGPVTPKKFLEQLARRTDGEFLDVPTASGLAGAYDRVRDLLDAEWELVIGDPDPQLAPAEPSLRIVGRPCSLRILGRQGDEERATAEAPAPLGAHGAECEPDLRWVVSAAWRLTPGPGANWRSEQTPSGLHGCVVDLTTDDGFLYDANEVEGTWLNAWREIGDRPFDVRAAPLPALPDRPALVLDAIARELMARRAAAPDPGPRQIPPERHARPFRDLPFLWNGRTTLAVRAQLAAALAERPEYAAYARERTLAEARRELDDLARTSRGLAPERVRQALAESPEGRAILSRAERPGPRDLERHLAAWLGDVPAVDAFRAWELDAVARVLAGDTTDTPSFAQAYRAAYRLFFAPSYVRILTPLVVGRDRASGSLGFWRIVLPRTAWIGPRKKDFADIESQHVPLDLVPDRPLGVWLAERLARAPAELLDRLRSTGLAPLDLSYGSLVKPKQRDPGRAYDQARVTLRLADWHGGKLVLVADLDRDGPEAPPAIRSLAVRASDDPALADLAAALEAALGSGLEN